MTERAMADISTQITSGGRIVIPAPLRRALGLKDGDEVLIRLEGGELRILTRRERVHRARAMVMSRIGAGRSLADELIAERREEAAGE
jgi:AbrB family looped-hinge helix DNA binding protein